MFSIVVGFPKFEDAANIRNVLIRNGFSVCAPCNRGAQVIAMANDLDEGVVVCGYRFSDMHYSEVYHSLPKGFEMLLVASPEKLEYCQDNNIVCLQMPIKTHDLINTLQMMLYQYQRRKKKEKERSRIRSEKEKEVINRAKLILMDRNNMSEEEAHRYLQKNSMDSQTSLVEMSKMVLRMLDTE